MKTQHHARRFVIGVTFVLAAAAVTTWAQAPQDLTPASMAALISEVRQLRGAIEEGGKRQTETQAIAVYLSAQQSRMVQMGQQLDAARTELATVSGQLQQFRGMLKSMQGDAASIDPKEREEADGMLQMFKPQLDAAAAREQQLRAREAELSASIVTEDARWRDLINRLEQMIKR